MNIRKLQQIIKEEYVNIILNKKIDEATINLSPEQMDKLHSDGSISVGEDTVTYEEPENPTPVDESKINEYGGSDFSKITSLQNFLTIDLDKFEKGLKDSKHKAIYKKARKQFMKVVTDVAWEHSKLHESKINEAKSKKVTKQMWAKMSEYQRMDALLTVMKDPDKAEKFLDKKWNQLPSGFERDMYTEGKLT